MHSLVLVSGTWIPESVLPYMSELVNHFSLMWRRDVNATDTYSYRHRNSIFLFFIFAY